MAEKPRSAEMHPGPGFRIRVNFPRLDRSLMEQLSAFPTPDVSDLLNRMYALNPAIHCLTGCDHRLWGPACTVRVFPGDNLMVHKSLDVVRPGDVIVVDAGGSPMNAVLGDLVATKAKHRGVAGFVVDGLVRDLPGLLEIGLPVYARGTSPIGPLHRGPGEINFPISCGGTIINPGDVIVADPAGIVAVPSDVVAEVVRRLREHADRQAEYLASVQRGDFSNAWVDRLLEQVGCLLVDESPSERVLPNGAPAGNGAAESARP
jgi:RraA family protein